MPNQFYTPASNRLPRPPEQRLGPLLQSCYSAIARFMVHRPQLSAAQGSAQSSQMSPEQRYSAKAALYPYLPSDEEQRDWLERLY